MMVGKKRVAETRGLLDEHERLDENFFFISLNSKSSASRLIGVIMCCEVRQNDDRNSEGIDVQKSHESRVIPNGGWRET